MDSSLNGAAVSDGATGEGTQVAAVLRNTGQGDNVIDVSFVGIDQVGDRGDKVFVVTDGCCNLVKSVKQAGGTINQVVDSSRTVGALSLDCGFESLQSSFNRLVIIDRSTGEGTKIGCSCHIVQEISNGNFLTRVRRTAVLSVGNID